MDAQTREKLRHGAAAGLRNSPQLSGYFVGLFCVIFGIVALAMGKGFGAAIIGIGIASALMQFIFYRAADRLDRN